MAPGSLLCPNYQFTLSAPSRDPNLLPVPAHESASRGHGKCPKWTLRLITVPIDVQRIIMSLLTGKDLSSLMQTCSYFLDIGLPELCLHIPKKPIRSPQHAISFYSFLRVGGWPCSRWPLIRALWLTFPMHWGLYSGSPTPCSYEAHMDALLGILRHCSHISRLHIDNWPSDYMGNMSQFLHAIPKSVEDLTIPLSPHMDGKHLSKLLRRPLRRLAFPVDQPDVYQIQNPHTSLVLQTLSPTLVEVDRLLLPRLDTPRGLKGGHRSAHVIASVRKLGVRMDEWNRGLVETLTAVFPNTTHFKLWPSPGLLLASHLSSTLDLRIGDETTPMREHNCAQWRMHLPAWGASLVSIWAAQLRDLYCLGVSRHVSCLSVPLCMQSEWSYILPTVLADMQPGFLELRLDGLRLGRHVQDSRVPPGLDDPGAPSVNRLAVHFVCAACHSSDTEVILNFIEQGWGAEMPLTHLLFRYRHTLREPIDFQVLVRDLPFPPDVARSISTTVSGRLARVAQAFPKLRWFGLDILGWGLKCWEVSVCPTAPKASVTLIETSEQSGRRVVHATQMDMFNNH
ncbi:hypothetical protein L226DRAFT_336975 [Lentinus tigrinus ALCF2SS1-7]|uniref:F-box domain-containing protein n=1 Tax=Lentinus tigrinus ALCF2SS1-6 TaxID=1328759 RepID=A0A5C2SGI2_9APHY|nr:hypothetical protein L227DRAFT_31440 [Lentinus tigrinus ALCF2SS1-6]RPD77941.1 hypothetical protein L226DRAFT_336975 [Lentinus tigrinus ALCF2SS1-7]